MIELTVLWTTCKKRRTLLPSPWPLHQIRKTAAAALIGLALQLVAATKAWKAWMLNPPMVWWPPWKYRYSGIMGTDE